MEFFKENFNAILLIYQYIHDMNGYKKSSGNFPSKHCGLGPVGFPKPDSPTSPNGAVSLYAGLDAVAGRQTRLPLSPHYNPRKASQGL